MTARLDITGRRFGRLTVLGLSHSDKHGKTQWFVRCDCGIEKSCSGGGLIKGSYISCGCFRLETLRTGTITHGWSKTPTYSTWKAMWKRCTNPKDARYHRYGGRGIKVCERWQDFAAFLADMGERPLGMTLHRLNHNGNYEPNNCEWRRPPH